MTRQEVEQDVLNEKRKKRNERMHNPTFWGLGEGA